MSYNITRFSLFLFLESDTPVTPRPVVSLSTMMSRSIAAETNEMGKDYKCNYQK